MRVYNLNNPESAVFSTKLASSIVSPASASANLIPGNKMYKNVQHGIRDLLIEENYRQFDQSTII